MPSARPGVPPPGSPGAPPALERPEPVRFGLGAYVAGLVLSLVGSVYSLVNIDSLVRQSLANASVDTSRLSTSTVHSFAVAGGVAGLVWLAVEALFVWFAWRGHNWARIVIWVLCGLGIVGGLITLAVSGAGSAAGLGVAQPGFVRGLSIFTWVLDVVAVVLLARPRSSEWYRYRRWLRATGQRG